jgi:hypothetical protein
MVCLRKQALSVTDKRAALAAGLFDGLSMSDVIREIGRMIIS